MALVRRLAVTLLVLLLGLADFSFAEQKAPSEYAVKAAFLVKFADYVDWPAGDRSGPFVVGVLGSDPFGDLLDRMVAGKEVHGRKLLVRRFSSAEEAAGAAAEIVFIGTSDEATLKRILRVLEVRPILTVGEMDQFASYGGMIGFRVQGNTVRFDINVERAGKARLKVSSQLLKLARIVRSGVV